MSLKGARVLLTGGTGFIGGHLAASLVAAGSNLTFLVRRSSIVDSLNSLSPKSARVIADLDDHSSLAAAVKAADPEYVFHLAKPRDGATFERQAKATTALAAALFSHAPHLKRWVRTAHAAPENLGRGADAALARALAERFKLPIATLELFLVYGPGQREGDFARVIAEDALDGRPLTAPRDEKDLVFVADVAEAYLLAAEAPKAAGAWIPVGGGRLIPGREVALAAAKATGRTDEVGAHAEPRFGGHPADPVSARALLAWAPRTSLDDGMAQLVQWLREARKVRHG